MTPRGNAIGIVVADMKASIAFYERLGLEFAADDETHQEAELAPGVRLMLDSEAATKEWVPGWTAPTGGPRTAIAFQCDGPAEVDAVYAELVAGGAGSVREPWDAPWGQRYATLHDPDGNGVDLYAPLAVEG